MPYPEPNPAVERFLDQLKWCIRTAMQLVLHRYWPGKEYSPTGLSTFLGTREGQMFIAEANQELGYIVNRLKALALVETDFRLGVCVQYVQLAGEIHRVVQPVNGIEGMPLTIYRIETTGALCKPLPELLFSPTLTERLAEQEDWRRLQDEAQRIYLLQSGIINPEEAVQNPSREARGLMDAMTQCADEVLRQRNEGHRTGCELMAAYRSAMAHEDAQRYLDFQNPQEYLKLKGFTDWEIEEIVRIRSMPVRAEDLMTTPQWREMVAHKNSVPAYIRFGPMPNIESPRPIGNSRMASAEHPPLPIAPEATEPNP